MLCRKKHYLCLSAPAMPVPVAPVAPGPGAYDLRDYEGPSKHYMSSSVFVSSSSRWHDLVADKTIPGPGNFVVPEMCQRWLTVDVTPSECDESCLHSILLDNQ